MQGTLHVAGHIDFGNHVDVTFSCIAYDITAFFLCIVTTIRDVVVDAHIAGTYDSFLTQTSFFSQFRISLYFETPALILCQMPVELVAAMQGHSIQELLDKLNTEEVATTIQQYTTIREAGLV